MCVKECTWLLIKICDPSLLVMCLLGAALRQHGFRGASVLLLACRLQPCCSAVC